MEADDLYHTAGQKGQAKHGGKKALGRRARGRRKKREPGRGHYDKDRPAIIVWVSRQGAVVIQATRDFVMYLRGALIGQPYLTLFGHADVEKA